MLSDQHIQEKIDHKKKEISLLKLILKKAYEIVKKKEKDASEDLLSELENV